MKSDTQAIIGQGRKRTDWSMQRAKSIDIPLNFLDVFSETNGFCLKLVTDNPNNWNPTFHKIFEITPTKQVGNVSVSVPRWKLYLEEGCGLLTGAGYRVCGPQGESIINFSMARSIAVSSSLHFGTKVSESEARANITDVHIPAEKENLGWIQLKQWFLSSEKTVVMMDRNVDSILTMEESGNYIKISNHEGVNIAILEPKRGLRKRLSGKIQWTDWKIKYQAVDSNSLTISSKIMIMVASLQKIQAWDYKNVATFDLAPP